MLPPLATMPPLTRAGSQSIAAQPRSKDDVPSEDFFPEDKTLFQMLWCPTGHDIGMNDPRTTVQRGEPAGPGISESMVPKPEQLYDEDFMLLPQECSLRPDRVTELPSCWDLPEGVTSEDIDSWLKENAEPLCVSYGREDEYEFAWALLRASWAQNQFWSRCDTYNARM